MNIDISTIIVIFISLPIVSWFVNRPRNLRNTNLTKLLSDFIKKDVDSIPESLTSPILYSSRSTKIPPLLNVRPTTTEILRVTCPKSHLHCQNCGYCTKTAVIHDSQWIYCVNKSRITTDGLNKHHWHKPETSLPCHTNHR